MRSILGGRLLATCWALAILSSFGLWASSYLNYSHYSRQRAYGFLRGTFQWTERGEGTYGAAEIFPNEYNWCWGTYTPDDESCYVVVKPGKARPRWQIAGTHPKGSLLRIDGRWTCFGFFGWQTIWLIDFLRRPAYTSASTGIHDPMPPRRQRAYW